LIIILSHNLEQDKKTHEERSKFLFETSLQISDVTKMKQTYTKNE